MSKPSKLVIDIETAPLEAYAWGLWDQNIGLEQIKTEWSILSFAAKWVGNKEIIYKDTSGRGAKKIRDDKQLVGAIWKLLDSADIVIAQNGMSFDLKKINARMIAHGYGPYSPVRCVDTLRVAKKHFGHTSNKLAWLSKHLTDSPKSEHKKFPGFDLWKECLADNPEAWAEMKKYNIQDVVATEKLYLKQLPWIEGHPNVSTYHHEGTTCPKCDSFKLQARGVTVTNSGRYQRFHCQACGAWSRGKQSLVLPEVRKGKLV